MLVFYSPLKLEPCLNIRGGKDAMMLVGAYNIHSAMTPFDVSSSSVNWLVEPIRTVFDMVLFR